MEKIAVIISPNWGDYAQRYLADCLNSLRQQPLQLNSGQAVEAGFKLFLIDNESTDASLALLQKLSADFVWPIEILRSDKNLGFAAGNNLAIRAALEQNFDYVFLLNMDAEIAPDCLIELLQIARQGGNKVGAVQARLMLHQNKEVVNSQGNVTHFLGFGYSKNNGKKYQSVGNCAIAYPSGAAALLRSSALEQIGLFDEELWMYAEDQDLGWRLWLYGYTCLLAEQAVVYHKYSFVKSISRYYWMERNRLINLIKNYKLVSLIVIAPAWLLMELGLWLFAWRGGWFKEKLKVYQYFLHWRAWRYLLLARREVQRGRTVSDRTVTKLFSGRILYQEIDSLFLRIGNLFFNLYWQVCKLIIWW